ncbi:energy-coupling factor transporter ATPase [Risungbinella massiliensis]|uniref:energy-coupling factor transporter ATPase n=1 Tax=Risungbinella massiliensis TaxID=1329796 RepID=UPI0005CBFBFF|nr:energy-coupling factor transporter ATPase [Risungbinella massiliensis]
MHPLIELNQVWFHYEEEEPPQNDWALHDISLSIYEGEYLSIIGPNGSGKSTLSRLLNGLYLPQKGEVLVDGLNTNNAQDIWEIRRMVGMVFQNPENQIVAPTVEDDIAFGLENLGVPRTDMTNRIAEVLERVGLTNYRKQEPHHLSGGQKQRLAIAGIIAMRPKVLVLDEATSMLDPEGTKSVLALAQELQQEGTTLIHITHSAEEAFRANRVLVLENGRVKLDLARDILYQQGEKLLDMGLDAPFEIQLQRRLRELGWEIPSPLQQPKDLVEVICRSLSKI